MVFETSIKIKMVLRCCEPLGTPQNLNRDISCLLGFCYACTVLSSVDMFPTNQSSFMPIDISPLRFFRVSFELSTDMFQIGFWFSHACMDVSEKLTFLVKNKIKLENPISVVC